MKKENGYPEVEKAVSEREISPLSFIFSRLKTAEGQFFIFIIMLLIYAGLKAVQASEIQNNS